MLRRCIHIHAVEGFARHVKLLQKWDVPASFAKPRALVQILRKTHYVHRKRLHRSTSARRSSAINPFTRHNGCYQHQNKSGRHSPTSSTFAQHNSCHHLQNHLAYFSFLSASRIVIVRTQNLLGVHFHQRLKINLKACKHFWRLAIL